MAIPRIKFKYSRASTDNTGNGLICPTCKSERELRNRKPKILSYILFVSNFAFFFWYTSSRRLELKMSILWVIFQIVLGAWAMTDRIQNHKPLYYCRRCNTRLPS